MTEILVLTTSDTRELAEAIARALVESGEAACVNIIPGIRSIYRWQGRICDEAELLLIIKSTSERFDSIRSRIKKIHTYQVPEVIALPVSTGDPEYLQWLQEQVKN
jgi:periplasmic divalent cation tolerance protein